jgi:Holliday junction resolvase
MANRNGRFGTERERKTADRLRDEDWIVIRTPGSKGAMDLVALRDGDRPRLIQVKGTAAGPFSDFGPEARAALLAVADMAGAVAELAWWPRQGTLRFIPSAEWP